MLNLNRRSNAKLFDAIVVGAGVIGLAITWRLVGKGATVCLVDGAEPGRGASWVAAGMLAPVAETAYGESRLLELTSRSARHFPAFVAELEHETGHSLGFIRSGALHIALDRDEAAELRRRYEYLLELGLDVELLGPSRCRELEPELVTSFHGGFRVRDESVVDPRSMAEALRAAIAGRSAGPAAGSAEVLTGEPAVEALFLGPKIEGVKLADGTEVRADRVIDACGSRSGSAEWIPPEARVPVRPVKGQILELSPTRDRHGAVEPLLRGIVSTGRVYLVPRADGRLVVGATVEEKGFDDSVTAGGMFELLREAYRAVPEIAELELAGMAAGLRPATPDNLPYIGEGSLEGLIHATGHYRNGVLMAPLTADAVSAAVAGEDGDEVASVAAPDRDASFAV